jgi:hypothetical protein
MRWFSCCLLIAIASACSAEGSTRGGSPEGDSSSGGSSTGGVVGGMGVPTGGSSDTASGGTGSGTGSAPGGGASTSGGAGSDGAAGEPNGSGGAVPNVSTGGAGGGTPSVVAPPSGLVALYTFGGSGSTVLDTSGFGAELNLQVYGGVERVTGGLRFTGNDAPIVVSTEPATKIVSAVKASKEISVELWFKASQIMQSGPARIFSLARENHHRNLSILHGPKDCGSYESGAFFQIRVKNAHEDNGCEPIVKPAEQPQINGQVQYAVYTQDASGLQRLWIDGALSVEDQDVEKNFDTFYDDTLLGLGNEPNAGNDATTRDDGRFWVGELYLVGVYSRALTSEEIASLFAAGPAGR